MTPPSAPDGASALEPNRLTGLRQAKLRAVAGNAGGSWEPGTFPAGATLRSGDAAWVLDEAAVPRAGAIVMWAVRRGIRDLTVVTVAEADAAADLARRLDYFEVRSRVLRLSGTDAVVTPPSQPPAPPSVGPHDLGAGEVEAIAVLRDGGLEVVIESGTVSGELLGLEVARVVFDDDAWGIALGIGRFDREMTALRHGPRPSTAVVREAAGTVSAVRRPGAPHHLLHTISRARWLRRAVLADPLSVGASRLEGIGSIVAASSVRDLLPAGALGVDSQGRTMLVVCSAGVDPELLPIAAELRDAFGGSVELVVAVSRGDLVDAQRAVADALVDPVRCVSLDPPWLGGSGDRDA